MSTLFDNIKRTLRQPSYLKTLIFAATVTPTNAYRVFGEEKAAGMKLLHTAGTPAEADLLRQVLVDAGFYMEHVPSASTGVFGTFGNSNIYVKTEEYADAEEFLREYLAPVEAEPEAER